ncbi:hypothetical protein BsWGS_09850 [Bradybaena similaris]
MVLAPYFIEQSALSVVNVIPGTFTFPAPFPGTRFMQDHTQAKFLVHPQIVHRPACQTLCYHSYQPEVLPVGSVTSYQPGVLPPRSATSYHPEVLPATTTTSQKCYQPEVLGSATSWKCYQLPQLPAESATNYYQRVLSATTAASRGCYQLLAGSDIMLLCLVSLCYHSCKLLVHRGYKLKQGLLL